MRSLLTRSSVRSADGAVVGVTVNTAALPDLLTVAGETSLTPFVLAILFSSLTSRGSLAVGLQELLLLVACCCCLVGGCDSTCCFASGCGLAGGRPRASAAACLLDRLLLLLLLLLLDLVQLLVVRVRRAAVEVDRDRSGPLVPGPKPLVSRS